MKKLLQVWFRLLVYGFGAGFVVACGDGSDAAAPQATEAVTPVTVGKMVSLGSFVSAQEVSISSILVLEIEWSIVSKPPNSQAVILNANSNQPTFRPDVVGKYVLKVVIRQNGEILVDKEVSIVAGLGDIMRVKPANHVPTTDICDSCHLKDAWLPVLMDHNQALGLCSGCHNGITISGMHAQHIPITTDCVDCHTTDGWLAASVVDHTAIVGNCLNCHNGINASGKSVLHMPTSDVCEACHNKFPTRWVPATMDHTQALGVCAGCHNGVLAVGKGPNHSVTTDDCSTCHWLTTWVIGSVDHTLFSGTCFDCHNGWGASSKSITHMWTTNLCEACHTVNVWAPVAKVDHMEVLGACVDCHNGVTASGKSANHIVSNNACETCHLTTRWLPAVNPAL